MDFPSFGERLAAQHGSDDVLEFLSRRRSNLAKVMLGDKNGPSETQLKELLTLAARVPDHRKLAPWRFVTFTGRARAEFGEVLAARFLLTQPEADEERTEFERQRFLRAHSVVAVISSPVDCARGTPEWEQILSAGAVCFQLLIGARAMGFAAQWLTEWYAYDSGVNMALGLSEAEKLAGYIYIGAASEPPVERARPEISEKIHNWGVI